MDFSLSLIGIDRNNIKGEVYPRHLPVDPRNANIIFVYIPLFRYLLCASKYNLVSTVVSIKNFNRVDCCVKKNSYRHDHRVDSLTLKHCHVNIYSVVI